MKGVLIGVGHDINDASFPIIYIVGPNRLQNQLLALCLEKELKVECRCVGNCTFKEFADEASQGVGVYLLDCFKREPDDLQQCLETGGAQSIGTFYSALFNVDPSLRTAKLVYRYKIRGIFYQKDTRPVFLKGMRTILKGDMWISRRVLSECVETAEKEQKADEHAAAPLSKREKETLRLVALGFSNDEIADKLNLSPHTVKTHLYHVYKKIGVSNRLQATLWAAAYLC